jgi:hypothetical protein
MHSTKCITVGVAHIYDTVQYYSHFFISTGFRCWIYLFEQVEHYQHQVLIAETSDILYLACY